jgi:hypothetical protein
MAPGAADLHLLLLFEFTDLGAKAADLSLEVADAFVRAHGAGVVRRWCWLIGGYRQRDLDGGGCLLVRPSGPHGHAVFFLPGRLVLSTPP